MSARTSYDEVPYFSRPFSQTHPGRLAVIARLSGLAAAPIEAARVLELGCAGGGNLIPLALTLPDARFVGVDLSAVQVAEGRELIAELGLTNVELRHADVLELDESLGTFDYAVVHGVYSWVPRPVQDKILALLRAHLAPNGVGYVSYNTFPGWRMRSMIRDMMLYHSGTFEEPEVRVRQARALLDYLAGQVPTEGNPYGMFLQRELEVLRLCGDSYLFHEHLEDCNEPLYFHQFVARAEAAGLRFLGEAGFGTGVSALFPGRMREGLTRGSEEFVRLEQYRDFVHNRVFRASLLCQREVSLEHVAGPEDLAGLWADCLGEPLDATPPPPGSSEPAKFRLAHEVEVEVRRPITKAALLELHAAWPGAVQVETLYAAAADRLAAAGVEIDQAAAEAELREDLLELFSKGSLELHPRPRPLVDHVSERPRASRLARAQAARERREATTLRHETFVLEKLDRALLPLLDGERKLPALVEAMTNAAATGVLDVRRDGLPVVEREPLREIFEEVVPMRLEHYRAKGLLEA